MSWAMSNKKRKASHTSSSSSSSSSSDAPPTVRVKRDANTIADFVGRYAFLANGFICQHGVRGVSAGGHIYPSVEHALQASKATDDATRLEIRKAPTAVDAKRIGNKLPLPPLPGSVGGAAASSSTKKAWKLRSREIVEALLRDKFRRNKSLAQELVETRGKELVYDNQWNDRFWGVSGGVGHNYLGALLEKIRTELVSAHDGGLSKWVEEQYDLCEQAEADATTLMLQAYREDKPTSDPQVHLRQGKFYTFGKTSGCDVTLRHGSISRTHAVLMLMDDGLLHCLDLRSTYGTKVNNKKLKPLEAKLLRKGDELRFGASSCSYRIVDIAKGVVQRSRHELYAAAMKPPEENDGAGSGNAATATVAAVVRASDNSSSRGQYDDGCTIFVGNVPYEATQAELKEHFSRAGTVTRANIPIDRATGAARGFAFVTFATYQQALKAQQLDGSTLADDKEMRELSVRLAKLSGNKDKAGGGGGGRGHGGSGRTTTGVNDVPVAGTRRY